MMTPDRPEREPDPCPAWCTRDHSDSSRSHSGASTRIGPFRARPYDSISASVYQYIPRRYPGEDRAPDAVEVSVMGYQFAVPSDLDPLMFLSVKDATQLAGLIEMLAGATARQHRDLAAAIRSACETIAPPASPERAA